MSSSSTSLSSNTNSSRRSPQTPPAPDAGVVVLAQVTEARTIEDVVKDPSLYLDRELFFDLIQDEGVAMTEIEASTHDPKLSKPKCLGCNSFLVCTRWQHMSGI